jgi:DIM1 family U5 snRNP protein
MLPHLHNGWQVDQAILSEEDRVVVMRFGHDWDPECMKMDETLFGIAEKIKNFAVVYLVWGGMAWAHAKGWAMLE